MATDRKTLATEIATTRDGRDITRGYVDALPILSPTDRVLPLAGGWRGYEELLRDDQVAACFAQRRLAVVCRPWTVEPGGPRRIDQQAAELLRRTLDAIGWDHITDQMLYARFYGFAVAEVIWAADRSGIVLDAIRVRDRARFGFAPDGRLLLRTSSQPNGEALPECKFWHLAIGASHFDEPYGRGLAHALYWPVWFKRNGARFWATYLEKFGAPTAVGHFPAGTDDATRTRLLEAVESVQTDAGIVLPEGMDITLIEAARGGTASYEQWLGYWDGAIAKVLLGQTMTTQDGSSRAQAQVHMDVRQDIVRADADLVSASANRSWVRWLIDLSLPGAAYPTVWRNLDDAEDTNQRADRDLKLFQAGWTPDEKTVADVYGPGYQRVAAPSLAVPEAAPTPAPSTGALTAAEAEPDPTPIDPIAARLDAETATHWIDMLDTIRQLVERADSLEQLQGDLLAAYGNLPTERLTEVMAMGFAAADLAGRFDLEQESRGG